MNRVVLLKSFTNFSPDQPIPEVNKQNKNREDTKEFYFKLFSDRTRLRATNTLPKGINFRFKQSQTRTTATN